MKKSLLLFVICLTPALAQKNEIGLTLGGFTSQTRNATPTPVDLSSGLVLEANYGRRVLQLPFAALYGELEFAANAQRTIQGAKTDTRDIATLYVTPGVRLKFLPKARISPWVAVGGGYAAYQQSTTLLSGVANPAIRNLNRGVFDFGGGIDTPLWHFIGLRAEVRDFYSGNPAYNAVISGSGQHNVLASGGIVLRFGK